MPIPPLPADWLDFARHLADLSRPILLQHYRSGIGFEDKDDASPVTIADRAAEAALRRAINQRFPDHGILGEEYGSEGAERDFVWVLDPIDGTKSFITGKPLFGTLIALAYQGRPVIGVVDMAALGECWWAARGMGAFFDGRPIRTRPCAGLDGAILYATTPHMFDADPALDAGWTRLRRSVKHALYGADCYGYCMLAAGWTDLVCEASVKAYDVFAPAVLITEAGGAVVGWDGAPLNFANAGQVLGAGDPGLLAAALAQLTDSGRGAS